ncbi:hypothetical protein ABZ851_10840 [Streptomyces sp. NPDC047049]|uniref:hypothetical protein n=1 Tax=Streptomyces sp. NPDC047049 TaxID=3156688 RepID=UPI0033C0E975
MSALTQQVRALFAQMPLDPDGALLVRRTGATGVLSVPVAGMELCREETAAALFEVYSDEYGLPGMSTDTLYDLLGAAVFEMGPAGLLETTDVFSGLDSVEFPEVGVCRWYAYRLAVSFWYEGARSRPMTAGEAAAALYLSDHARIAGAPSADPRRLARHVRQGAGQVPTAALLRLGSAVSADLARVPDARGDGGWLYRRLMPDRQRARRCLDLIRSSTPVPLPLIVRTETGDYLTGATPPPGPGNRWARPLRAEW